MMINGKGDSGQSCRRISLAMTHWSYTMRSANSCFAWLIESDNSLLQEMTVEWQVTSEASFHQLLLNLSPPLPRYDFSQFCSYFFIMFFLSFEWEVLFLNPVVFQWPVVHCPLSSYAVKRPVSLAVHFQISLCSPLPRLTGLRTQNTQRSSTEAFLHFIWISLKDFDFF